MHVVLYDELSFLFVANLGGTDISPYGLSARFTALNLRADVSLPVVNFEVYARSCHLRT